MSADEVISPVEGPCPFITFYSFKGGVGRSMALINVAGILAARGFRVLVLDMDLEAPGLSYLANDPSRPPQPGFVELLLDATERGPEGDLFVLPAADAIRPYCAPYSIPEVFEPHSESALSIMPAGCLDGGYSARLERLNLPGLYHDGLGLPTILAFKQVLQESGLFDYVFVDSRTGFSDESGICTRDLADYLIVLSGLNRQNIEGTTSFLRAFRAASEGDRGLEVVLSPIPNGEDALVDERTELAEDSYSKAWGTKIACDLQIPYHPQLALTEEPHIFRRRRGYLYESYVAIEARVRELAGVTVEALQDVAIEHFKNRRFEAVQDSIMRATRLGDTTGLVNQVLAEIADSDPIPTDESARQLYAFLGAHATQRHRQGTVRRMAWKAQVLSNKRQLDDASTLFKAALELDPNEPQILGNYAVFLCDERRDLDAAESFYKRAIAADPNYVPALGNYALFLKRERRDLDAAESFYKRAIAADPNNAHNLGNYANFLWKERRDLDAAEPFYKRAIAADPNNVVTLGNYALFLSDERGDLDAAESFYKRAIAAANNNANNLGNYALFLKRERRDLDAAESFYKRAIDADPNYAPALGNYATFLCDERRDLDTAESFYKRAIAADPNNANNLGNYATFLHSERRDLDTAESFYKRAIAADPNNANHLGNYARLLLSRGELAQGLEMVERAISLFPAARPSEVDLECWMYLYCCAAPSRRSDALKQLYHLVTVKRLSTGDWDFSGVIAQAKRMGHPEAAHLPALAEVLAHRQPPESLAAWASWRSLAAPQEDGASD